MLAKLFCCSLVSLCHSGSVPQCVQISKRNQLRRYEESQSRSLIDLFKLHCSAMHGVDLQSILTNPTPSQYYCTSNLPPSVSVVNGRVGIAVVVYTDCWASCTCICKRPKSKSKMQRQSICAFGGRQEARSHIGSNLHSN